MSGRGGLKQAFASQGCSLAIFGYRKGVRERSLDVAAVRGQLSSGMSALGTPLGELQDVSHWLGGIVANVTQLFCIISDYRYKHSIEKNPSTM